MDKANIGSTLKMLREERELTMDMLVIDLNQRYNVDINKSQLSRWERNEPDTLGLISLDFTLLSLFRDRFRDIFT